MMQLDHQFIFNLRGVLLMFRDKSFWHEMGWLAFGVVGAVASLVVMVVVHDQYFTTDQPPDTAQVVKSHTAE